MRKIGHELTSFANLPLFFLLEENWPWANICAHLPLFCMWNAATAWLDEWCVDLCPGSEPANLGPLQQSMQITTPLVIRISEWGLFKTIYDLPQMDILFSSFSFLPLSTLELWLCQTTFPDERLLCWDRVEESLRTFDKSSSFQLPCIRSLGDFYLSRFPGWTT